MGLVHQQQLVVSQNPNIRKTWTVTPYVKPLPVIYDVHKPSINVFEPLEYNVFEDLKKIKANILMLNICKVPHNASCC
jgi:hypothetical protein